jgi:hypothetical protein
MLGNSISSYPCKETCSTDMAITHRMSRLDVIFLNIYGLLVSMIRNAQSRFRHSQKYCGCCTTYVCSKHDCHVLPVNGCPSGLIGELTNVGILRYISVEAIYQEGPTGNIHMQAALRLHAHAGLLTGLM